MAREEPIRLELRIEGETIKALVDTGAMLTVIQRDVAIRVGLSRISLLTKKPR